MTMRLRNYIKVYDNVVDEEIANSIIDLWNKYEEQERIYAVVIDDREVYEQLNLTHLSSLGDDIFNLQEMLMHMTESYRNGYLTELYGDDTNRFSSSWDGNEKKEFDDVFFMRKYDQTGFYEPNYGSRCGLTSNRFLSYIMYLNDVDGGDLVFDPVIRQNPIKPKRGRLIIFPSNWMYPIKELAPKDDKYMIYGYSQWAPVELKGKNDDNS